MDQKMKWLMWFMGGLLCILEMMFRNAPSVMTRELMEYYGISSAQLGLLVSSYYYPYVLLQVPGGIILDQWGTRRMSLFITTLSTLAFMLFASGINLWTAYLGRILLGLAASCAFITTLKIASQRFSAKRFSTMSGLTNMMLTIGGIVAGYPLAYLLKKMGWQKACFVLSGIGLICTILMFFIMKDRQNQRGSDLHVAGVIKMIKRLVKDTTLLRIGLISACLYLPFSVFAELWAIPYLTTTSHLPTTQAASISVLLYVGSAVGSLFLTPLLRLVGSYSAGLRLTTISIMILFTTLNLFPSLPSIGVISIFLTLGIVATGQMLVFSWAHEGAAENEQGMRLGFVNAITMTAPVLIQPLFGYVLDYFWTGAMSEAGVKVYTASAYNNAILLFPVFCALALLLLIKKGKDSV
jgi:predicted MFS family arabinose efflux permease